MKTTLRLLPLFLFISIASICFAQPAPNVLRNPWSTNRAGTAVHGTNDLSVTNQNDKVWRFWGTNTSTVARLVDVSNSVSGTYVKMLDGSSTNQILTIPTNFGMIVYGNSSKTNALNVDGVGQVFSNTIGVLTVTGGTLEISNRNFSALKVTPGHSNVEFAVSSPSATYPSALVIGTNGYVGIGTNDQSYALSVVPNRVLANPFFVGTGTGGVGIMVSSNGYLGQGTFPANANFELVGGSTGVDAKFLVMRNNFTAANTATTIKFVNSTSHGDRGGEIGVVRKADGSGDMMFRVNTDAGAMTERVRIMGSGNVGIGTTVPLLPLHVNGSTLLSNNTANSDQTISFQNDVQKWTAGVYGTSDDRFFVQNVTSNTMPFWISTNNPNNVLVVSNGYVFVTAPTNGVAPVVPALVAQPIGCFGSIMYAATNTVTCGLQDTYYRTTNYTVVRTNGFIANGLQGYLTNVYAGFYRITCYLSMLPATASETFEVEFFVNETGREEVSMFGTWDNPARVRTVSATGILYLPAMSGVSVRVNNRSAAHNVDTWRGGLTIGTP